MPKAFRISEPPREVDEILALIEHAPSGREVLSEFLPHYRVGKISIRPYPEEIAAKLRAARTADQPAGASFVTDGRSGTIHVDLGSELGILAPFLFHEIVHSLDERLWVAARTKMDEAMRERIILTCEERAFECQFRFVQELIGLVSELDAFLKKNYPDARIVRERLTTAEIRKLYGIKAA